jgi:hypothetical protein
MIYTDSRYADGKVFSTYTTRGTQYQALVFRQFPVLSSGYSLYFWREEDRIDTVAKMFLGDASKWWAIMDINPEILNPYDIAIGTTIRIPRG